MCGQVGQREGSGAWAEWSQPPDRNTAKSCEPSGTERSQDLRSPGTLPQRHPCDDEQKGPELTVRKGDRLGAGPHHRSPRSSGLLWKKPEHWGLKSKGPRGEEGAWPGY